MEVYYLEHVLSSWVLESSPWNAYHSGMGFQVKSKLKNENPMRFHIEFIPRRTGQVRWVLHPEIKLGTKYKVDLLPEFAQNIVTWLMGDYEVNWENDGAVFITPYWLEKYSNITKIGETTGLVINKFRIWLFDYQDNNKHFEPVEVVSELGDHQFLPSVMCHDLFYNALYHLHELGFEPHPESPIFRDHIVVYAKKVEEVVGDIVGLLVVGLLVVYMKGKCLS